MDLIGFIHQGREYTIEMFAGHWMMDRFLALLSDLDIIRQALEGLIVLGHDDPIPDRVRQMLEQDGVWRSSSRLCRDIYLSSWEAVFQRRFIVTSRDVWLGGNFDFGFLVNLDRGVAEWYRGRNSNPLAEGRYALFQQPGSPYHGPALVHTCSIEEFKAFSGRDLLRKIHARRAPRAREDR